MKNECRYIIQRQEQYIMGWWWDWIWKSKYYVFPKQKGYNVKEAINGEDGISLIKKMIDLVFWMKWWFEWRTSRHFSRLNYKTEPACSNGYKNETEKFNVTDAIGK